MMIEDLINNDSGKKYVILDGEKFFNLISQCPSLCNFEKCDRNDLQIFCESILFNFENEQKLGEHNFYKKLQSTCKIKYKLICGHTKIVKHNFFFNIYKINKKQGIQEQIDSYQAGKFINGTTFQLCLECMETIDVDSIFYEYTELPDVFFLEIERGYIDDYGNLKFYDDEINVDEKIVINNVSYTLESFINYNNMHYSAVIKKSEEFYNINNTKLNKINRSDAFKLANIYGRMIIYTKIS
ncbi:hypothetical protein EDEG_02264 [Edhazardia aedis USNM 41457]|uniref:Ubiquitinyl hydrolase 1 n=1 Tax=Edhazardia aedis (strain USNM 41457) TaxID=1003232 RepID=J9DPW2_EDHAE|nr:hypothetical protein EDEG_02264 [Edhazardia aedis USNM 41457]|eukprot:EJW03407.1 hypothetical protein EDEG_02264 [Edhazardia aedis USNM 41457]